MYLLTIDCREVAGRPGVVTGSGEILDLAAAPSTLSEAQWIPHSVISILAAGDDGRERVARLLELAESSPERERLRAAGALLPFADTRLMAPVRRPGLVLVCDTAATAPGEPEPVTCIKSPNTVAGHGAEVRVPWPADEGVRVAAMAAVVLGRPLHRASEAEAGRAIAGYTLLLDFSRPDPGPGASLADWRRYVDSKQFPDACPVGPSIVTPDSLDDSGTLTVSLAVNGVAGAGAALDLSRVAAELAALSRRYGFRPGDLVGLAAGQPGLAGGRGLQDSDRLQVALAGHMALDATVRCRA